MDEPIRFFLPGPTYVRRDVREAMTAEMIGHRGPAFRELYESVTAKLPPVFRTERPVYVATSSATLLMQSAIMSAVDNRVLHLVCGAFSLRWYDISRSLGVEADKIEVPWGEAIDPDLVRRALERLSYDAVTFAHNETSTGVMNPAAEIAAAVREASDALVMVDTVSSLGGAPVEVDEWGLDVVLTGSQKAMALPPGLAFFALSERAVERMETVENRGFYTDMLRYRAKHEGSGTITTPAISILYAADRQLDRMLEETMEARWQRHRDCQRRVVEWAESRDLGFLPQRHRSLTISCLKPPRGIAAPDLVAGVAERGFVLGGGYGKLKPETFRLGHMGEVGLEDLEPLFRAIDEVLAEA
ncbi:MAG: alanine--glyoxylate aminotransferase family protein [Thermoanaerobaculia bacterium]|nr:alanine--glyoxylate aminotransferase family protein [Thermoanaerobaculia bacterium]